MVGSEILSRMGLEAKTVECLELLDRLLPNETEFVVESVGWTNGEICRISVRQKMNQAILYAKTDRIEGLWSCLWVVHQQEVEEVANHVLKNFGKVKFLYCMASQETYPLDDVPRFSSQDEFRMKVMLRGGVK